MDQILCLGDLVGYHADPEGVVNLVRGRSARVIAGNHDRAATGAGEPDYFSSHAKTAICWTRGALSVEATEFLARLPTSLVIDDTMLLTHGAVHPEPNEHVRLGSEQAAAASFAVLERHYPQVRLCFFGHMHRQVVYELSRGRVSRHEQNALELDPDSIYLINPGSVGQPRDGDPRSAFCVYDSASSRLQFHRVPYDVAACRSKARRAGLVKPLSITQRVVRLGRRSLRALHRRLPAFTK